MAYELHNPHRKSISVCLGRPFATFLIPGGTFFPSPKQEEEGLTAKMLEASFVSPTLLKKTTASMRRRLLQASGLPIPAELIEATKHLSEFGGNITLQQQATVDEATGGLEDKLYTQAEIRPVREPVVPQKPEVSEDERNTVPNIPVPSLPEESDESILSINIGNKKTEITSMDRNGSLRRKHGKL